MAVCNQLLEWAEYYKANPETMWTEEQAQQWLSDVQLDPMPEAQAPYMEGDAYDSAAQYTEDPGADLLMDESAEAADLGVGVQEPVAEDMGREESSLHGNGVADQHMVPSNGPFGSADAQAQGKSLL